MKAYAYNSDQVPSFGHFLAYCRGLPHAHILVILAPEHAPHSIEDIDSIVCAELPDKDTEPLLFAAVTTHMLHGPHTADSPCLDDHGHCTKRYPKAWQPVTTNHTDAYPIYRRRQDDRCHWMNRQGQAR